MQTVSTPRTSRIVLWLVIGGFLAALAFLVLISLLSGSAQALALFIPAFLAGILSFLSPCTLPVLPAYFAWTFGINSTTDGTPTQRQLRTLTSSLAFFAGLATTMILLNVVLITAFRSLIVDNLKLYTHIGGVLIILMGVLSFFGKGFAGPTIKRSSKATLGSAYLYGLTFAVGWTACIGPILGTILTWLITSGSTVFAGAILTFVYVSGLGLPLIIVATFFNRLGQGSSGWRLLRGRAWDIQLGSKTLMLHSTNILSGVLLVIIGILLYTGTLSTLNQYSLPGGISEWANNIQFDIQNFFGLN